MPNSKFALALAVASLAALSGCISSTKTEIVDEPKQTITFESKKAEEDFLSAVERRKSVPSRIDQRAPEERSSVWLVVVNVSHRKITSGPNRDFNQFVRGCDVDGNGVISEREAEVFLKTSPVVPARANPDTTIKN
ncbi:MAG: hypothetical protein QM790_09635 [Nibricoccus sp.]